jgi:hypothetical protein
MTISIKSRALHHAGIVKGFEDALEAAKGLPAEYARGWSAPVVSGA